MLPCINKADADILVKGNRMKPSYYFVHFFCNKNALYSTQKFCGLIQVQMFYYFIIACQLIREAKILKKILEPHEEPHKQFILSSFSYSVVSDSATPWTAARPASLSITNSQSLPKLMFIESVMLSNHLILCHSLLLPSSVFPSIRVFSSESVLHIR